MTVIFPLLIRDLSLYYWKPRKSCNMCKVNFFYKKYFIIKNRKRKMEKQILCFLGIVHGFCIKIIPLSLCLELTLWKSSGNSLKPCLTKIISRRSPPIPPVNKFDILWFLLFYKYANVYIKRFTCKFFRQSRINSTDILLWSKGIRCNKNVWKFLWEFSFYLVDF